MIFDLYIFITEGNANMNILKHTSLLAIVFFYLQITPALAAEPVKHVCSSGNQNPYVRIVGQRGDLVEIVKTDNSVMYKAYVESRDQMGNARGALNCEDVQYHGDMIVIRMGHENDLVQAYGIVYSNNNPEKLHQMIWNPHDSRVDISHKKYFGGHILEIVNGHKRDLKYTFCWIKEQGWTTASKQARTGRFEACDVPYKYKTIP